ncbi:MAG: hypothetical protein GQ570_05385 [Helicobacteraceae bacterium]|nr:hypothetical protein [Helicobacteraceae bacterium]
MKIYYLYSNSKEISKYVVSSLQNYEITLVDVSSELFKIEPIDSLLILHTDSYDGDSLELVEYLLKDMNELNILALTNNVNIPIGSKFLQAGVKGYGNIYMHSVLLSQAVEVIMSGNVWIYPELTMHLIRNLKREESISEHKLEQLSVHEKECALLAVEGNSNKEIAKLVNLQEITIKKHLSSTYKKLNIKNRMELALYLK